MSRIDEILIVDNDQSANKVKMEKLQSAGVCNNFKVAMNGGHALVCVDHMHMARNLSDKKIMILLNLDTPIENGYVFLQKYFRNAEQYKKENMLIVVVEENLTPDKRMRAEMLGAKHFVSSVNCEELTQIANEYFQKRSTKKKGTGIPNDLSHLRVA